MRKKAVFSLILSLFLISCGIPTWFYISTSDARLTNTSSGSTVSTRVMVETDWSVDVKVMLLYTIHNASSSTTPSSSSIQSGLINTFTSNYRLNTANSNRFSNSSNPVATYTNTAEEKTFNLYALKVVGSSDESEAELPLNGAGSSLDYLFHFDTSSGAAVNETITYRLDSDGSDNLYLYATVNEGEADEKEYRLARYDSSAFLRSSEYQRDSRTDHEDIENGSYSLYILPVMYISAIDGANDYSFSNIMLVNASNFVSLDLT